MANVEHSVLTGSNLHEPKGVAAAAANRVYVSDGAGSGSWTTISNSALATSAKPFQAQLLHMQDQKATGTDGGTFTSGAWRTRVLNTTLTNEIASATLVSNQISLPAGTYFLDASAPGYKVGSHIAKLANITDTSDILIGTAEDVDTGIVVATRSHVSGRFTLSGTKTLELQHRGEATRAGNGFGAGSAFSVVCVYADVKIWKVG